MSGRKPFSTLTDGFSEERKNRLKEESKKPILEMESQTSAYNDLKHIILIQWSERENSYLVSLPDFSKEKVWFASGDSYEEALKNGL